MTRIAICAPATPITREVADAVIALAAAEFPPLDLAFHEQCFALEGHFAGSDALRLAALLECANDPQVDAVWFAKGGYGANRIARDALTGLTRRRAARRFSAIRTAGYLLAGLYREGIGSPSMGRCRSISAAPAARWPCAARWAGLRVTPRGWSRQLDERPSVAFNLMTLATLCGTPLMPDLTGHVVMVEEVAEHLYAIDRLFSMSPRNCAGSPGCGSAWSARYPRTTGRSAPRPRKSRATGARGTAFRSSGARRYRPRCGQQIVPFGLARSGPRA